MVSWLAWWGALGAVALGPAVPALGKLSRAAKGSIGEVTGGMSNLDLGAKVMLDGVELWTGSVHALVAVGWIVVPPLVLFALFLRRARRGQQVAQLTEGSSPQEILLQRAPESVREDR